MIYAYIKNITLQIFPKIRALCIGYIIWYIISSSFTTDVSLTVPIAFYGLTKNYQIEAPETMDIQLTGKRHDLRVFDIKNISAHIDAHTLKPGEYHIPITPEIFFLPDTIKLIHYKPSYIYVHVYTQTTC